MLSLGAFTLGSLVTQTALADSADAAFPQLPNSSYGDSRFLSTNAKSVSTISW
jgi:hypothetical protein